MEKKLKTRLACTQPGFLRFAIGTLMNFIRVSSDMNYTCLNEEIFA